MVIDECDAVFRRRSTLDGSSEITRASAVNQILSKLDGMNSLDNLLLIGMTNRRSLLDPALLRPGRLEVQIEIPLPDCDGRREILQIHFQGLRNRGRLSQPLCYALDGVDAEKNHVSSIDRLGRWFGRLRIRHGQLRIRDLADDRWTGGFSGADLAGLVRNAGSFALARAREQLHDGSTTASSLAVMDSLLITLEDVDKALKEIKQ